MPPDYVLILEDEPIIAMEAEDLVRDVGLVPVTAQDVDAGEALAMDADLLGAIIDHEVRGGTTVAIGRILASRRIPFVVTTGSVVSEVADAYGDAPVLTKPWRDEELIEYLNSFRRRRGDSSAV